MEETNNTIYDDVFRTIQERHPGLLIPLVNEAFHIPSSCIFYLRHGKHTGREGTVEIELSDGQKVSCQVLVIKAQGYTLEELFEKKLYICLPCYIMRYEKSFHKISGSEEKTSKLLQEYGQMLTDLWDKTGQDETGLYQDLLRLIRKTAEYQLRNEAELKEPPQVYLYAIRQE